MNKTVSPEYNRRKVVLAEKKKTNKELADKWRNLYIASCREKKR